MILTDIKTAIRENLTDTVAEYRFSDGEITAAVDAACAKVAIDRTDMLLGIGDALQTIEDSTDISKIPENFQSAIISYACYRLFLKDGEDTHNANLAELHRRVYLSEIR